MPAALYALRNAYVGTISISFHLGHWRYC